jgi:hypothetical protein
MVVLSKTPFHSVLSLSGQIYLKLNADKQAEAGGHGNVNNDHFENANNIGDVSMMGPHDSLAQRFRGKIQNVRPSAPNDLV